MEANPKSGIASKVREMCLMLMVFDMPDSLHFFCDILGFELIQSVGPEGDTGWAMMRLGNIWLMLNTLYELSGRPALPDSYRILAHGDTAFYFGCPDIDGIYEHIKSNGIDVKVPYSTGYGFRAINFKDPDGYTIVFQCELEELRRFTSGQKYLKISKSGKSERPEALNRKNLA